ncbi:MAG: AtpZ/AtpI family protein [Planctomycetota bacterium]|nr:AtpZ/AtpI family protein [Planctomycetota bacterium]
MGADPDRLMTMEEKPQQDPETQDTPPASDGDSPKGGSHARGLVAGYTLGGGLVVGLVIGYALDSHFGTKPLWTVSTALLFMLAGLYQVVKDNIK